MFIGREDELHALAEFFASPNRACMVYGKRKVGKTTLIKQALTVCGKRTVYYECVKGSLRENIDGFVAELVREKILPAPLIFENFGDVFAYLNTLPFEIAAVIDEYPYLKALENAQKVDSVFQSVIDNRLKNICLILSGSHIGMMKEMFREGNSLYGRFHSVIRLAELSYQDCAAFYPKKTVYDKIAFYSVFGGSPYVNEMLDGKKDLRENIIGTILNTASPLYLYASHLLMSDFTSSLQEERIFSVLGNSAKRYTEIENRLGAKKTGSLNKQLKPLIEMEQVRRTLPINRPHDDKKAAYELNDNLMRFYYTYVYKQKSALEMLGAAAFYDEYVAATLTEFISRRFEEICRSYFSRLAKSGKLPGIRNIGRYYYDDPATKTNGEFDVALEYDDGCEIWEVKYLKAPMDLSAQHREIGRIRAIREFSVAKIGFISAVGFAEKEDGIGYIDGSALYETLIRK